MPFCLPRMHERYFYLADVLSVIARVSPSLRSFYAPLVMITMSFMAYQPTLFGANRSPWACWPSSCSLLLIALLSGYGAQVVHPSDQANPRIRTK